MNGLEALQAMKEGRIVAYRPQPKYSDTRLFKYRSAYKHPGNDSPKKIWMRWTTSWVWKEVEQPTIFWMEAGDDFEIVEDEE